MYVNKQYIWYSKWSSNSNEFINNAWMKLRTYLTFISKKVTLTSIVIFFFLKGKYKINIIIGPLNF